MMTIFTTIQELQQALDKERENGASIGLVPTMGALHAGHLSLVSECIQKYDRCVVSVFVNPTQFNNAKDLETYPRTPENDFKLLEEAGCHYVFYPSVEELYPTPDTRQFDLGFVAETMEGAFRPGHFNGVAQVVSKLFMIVKPHGAFFGEKDFQQIAVIKKMVQLLSLPVEIHSCPIVRESNGLALSSRNQRLSPEEKEVAPTIYKTLKESTLWKSTLTPKQVIDKVVDTLSHTPHLKPEYYTIVDSSSLKPITQWSDSPLPIGCIACYCGEVRLIDNIKY